MDPDEAFPFPLFRPYEREILQTASTALFDNPTIDTVVIEFPAELDPAAINIALARLANSSFYTSPKDEDHHPLEKNTDLAPYYSAVKSCSTVICGWASTGSQSVSCTDCPITRDPKSSCRDKECEFWMAKQAAILDDTAAINFSDFLIDNLLPTHVEEPVGDSRGPGRDRIQHSFMNRELLIVDDAHLLEDNVATQYAGFHVSDENFLPDGAYDEFIQEFKSIVSTLDTEYVPGQAISTSVERLHRQIIETIQDLEGDPREQVNMSSNIQNLITLESNLGFFRHHVAEGQTWVVTPTTFRSDSPTVRFQPDYVDQFLQEYVWSRASKRVLSTRKIPPRDDQDQWLRRLGLNPHRVRVISIPISSPSEDPTTLIEDRSIESD